MSSVTSFRRIRSEVLAVIHAVEIAGHPCITSIAGEGVLAEDGVDDMKSLSFPGGDDIFTVAFSKGLPETKIVN